MAYVITDFFCISTTAAVRNCAEIFEIVLCKIILYQDLGENSQDLGIYIACLRNEIRNCVMKSVITPITFNYVSITRN